MSKILKLNKSQFDSSTITHLQPSINYTIIHFSNKTNYISSYTMKLIFEKLSSDFVKIGRFGVVNKKYIDSYDKGVIKLSTGVELKVTRRYLHIVQSKIN